MNDEAEASQIPALDLSDTRPMDSAILMMNFPGSSKPTGWSIVLAGPAHTQTIALGDDLARESLDKELAIEMAQVNGRKWKGDGNTPDDRRQRNVKLIAGRILGWSPNPTFKFISPDPIVFSRAAAISLFLRPDMGRYFQQMVDYINGEKAFTAPSDKI